MKILYISAMCSSQVIDKIYRKSGQNPGFAMQKFNRLIAEGFAKNGVSVQTLSAVPNCGNRYSFIREKEEIVKGIVYKYIPVINFAIIRQFCLFFYTFFYVLWWGLRKKKDKVIIFDVLNISVCLGGMLGAKLVNIKSCGIMTDMPGLMVGMPKTTFGKIASFVNKRYLSRFDYYVFLTEPMNDTINVKNRPYIIMEGLVDSNDINEISAINHRKERRIMYAGGLYEQYGLRLLVEAFTKINEPDIVLELYGHGDFIECIKEISKKDSRVKYMGIVSNDVIVAKEQEAILLVNPRPTSEVFTKYSFPSKNMEYMMSGTAVLTTKLPGMPKEYYPYVYLIDNETITGYYDAITYVLTKDQQEIDAMGLKGRTFVATKKNNIVQAKRILRLLASE